MTGVQPLKRLETNRQIGILRISAPVPIIEKATHPILREIAHHMIVVPGWAPLWFDYSELGGEVWTAVDVATIRSEVCDPLVKSLTFQAIRPPKFAFLRWSEHEVAASVMAKWAGHPHPIWDWQIDMAAARPEWEYDRVITDDEDLSAVVSIEFRRGVLLPPL